MDATGVGTRIKRKMDVRRENVEDLFISLAPHPNVALNLDMHPLPTLSLMGVKKLDLTERILLTL